MQFIFKFIVSVCCVVLLSLAPQVEAQDLRQYVKKTQTPQWVLLQSAPLEAGKLEVEGNKVYHLSDLQQRISQTTHERYRHNIIELKTSEAVQDNSNFSISFDPSYQKISIHHLSIIRGDKKLNRLELSDFDLYRVETDREKLLYDGTMEVALIIPDVQVGDILDYSYTIIGKNKAFGPHYYAVAQLQFSVPIQRLHRRILLHKNLPVNIKTYNNPIEPTEKTVGNYQSYNWLQDNLESINFESNLPAWYFPQPYYDFSSYKNWKEVGEYFADKYQLDYAKGGAISDIANMIEEQSGEAKLQARLALNYVHENIRYTGIEMGSGGYIPRPQEKTLRQKFGDCKDMSVLLIAILREMDIKAHPVFVDSDYRKHVDETIPSHAAFDHVIVRVEIDGEAYFLDGTRGKQLGDLDHLEQGSYSKGLLLESGNAQLIDIAIKQPPYYKYVEDRFELLSDPENVSLESTTTYYGYEADSMNSFLINDGRKKIEKNFFEFFQNTYPDIEQVGDAEIKSFPEMGKFIVKVNYKLGKGWVENEEKGYKGFEAYPSDVSSDTPNFKGGKRTMPYSLSHPRKSRHKLIFKLDDTWLFEDEDIKIENSAFLFRKTSTFKNGTYTEDYAYTSKQDYIPPESFSSIMISINKLNDELGVELTDSTDWFSNLSENMILAIIGLYISLVLFIVCMGAFLRRKIDLDWQNDQIFYPVKLSKFIFLSLITIGFYSYYWSYKNWRWIRDVEKNPNMPLVRSFFMIFTNFSLLLKFAEYENEDKGFPWYSSSVALLLASIYLVLSILGNLSDQFEAISMWLLGMGLISFIALIPSAMQVNRLNSDRKDIIAKNSAYHWTTMAYLLMFLPILAIIIYAFIP